MTERQIGLRKRTRPFTQVPNDVVDDFTIGYRELGLLVRILRMPDGFVIRSEQLASEGKGKTLRGRKADREGREAVRTALRKLAMAGYYRLVRIRFPDGTFAMATDISEDPVETWASQAAVFGGRPVLIYRDRDGNDQVKYPDGTMLPDDTMPPKSLAHLAEQDARDDAAEEEPDPKPGNPSSDPKPGNPSPGDAATGKAATGDPGPLNKMVSKDGQQDSVPASQVRPGSNDEGQLTIDGDTEPLAKEPTTDEVAFGVARAWIDYRAEHGKPVVHRTPLHAVKGLVLPFLSAGYTEREVKKALNGLGEALPSRQQMQRALDTIRDGRVPGAFGRPQQRVGGRVNDHWKSPELVGAASVPDAPAAPKADRIRTERPTW